MIYESQMRAVAKYEKNNYHRIGVRVRKDSKIKERLEKASKERGVSISYLMLQSTLYVLDNNIEV